MFIFSAVLVQISHPAHNAQESFFANQQQLWILILQPRANCEVRTRNSSELSQFKVPASEIDGILRQTIPNHR